MKHLKRLYYMHKIQQANDDIALVKGMHNACNDQLIDNIVYIRSSASLKYYTTMLSVVNY